MVCYALYPPVDVIRQGLLSDDVACEEPIKSALCDLLHHLCDCQVISHAYHMTQ